MKRIVNDLTEKPGVYLFKDEKGQILYVGKAKNLKKRVSSYFNKHDLSRPWIKVMIGLIKNIETHIVNNETEALMLEATLIKQYLPKFNILMTDDKSYPYIKLTTQEEFPRLLVVRKHINDGSKYFGPYLSSRAAKFTCEFMRRIYGIHISNSRLRTNQDRPCLNCQMDNNLCPLNGEISAENYREKVDKAIYFLQGRRKMLVEDLKEKMELASKNQNFELAAKLRDQMKGVRSILGKQHLISTNEDDFDIIALATSGETACLYLMTYRDGRPLRLDPFYFDMSLGKESGETIRQFLLTAFYNVSNIPPQIIIGEKITDQKLIEHWLSEIRGSRVELRVAERGVKANLLKIAQNNAQINLESRLIKGDQAIKAVVALKDLLKLDFLPTRIEAVDISNLGTSEAVGAVICFINGKPDKNEYRRYKIKSVIGQNDFAMIEEVVQRRFMDTNRAVPDLFIIDGGVQQLNSALKGLKKTTLQPKYVISLAKKPDRVFIPGRSLPISTPRGDKGLMLMSRVRDEVHRFAISFQRYRQSKKSLQQ